VAGASTCAVSVGLGCALGAAGVAGSVAQYSDGLERLNTGFVSSEGQHVLDSFRPGTHPGDVSLGSRIGGYVVSSAAELVLERVGGKAIGAAVHAVDGKRGGTTGKVTDGLIPPGMERPFRPVNPEFPPNTAVVDAMKSPQIKGMTVCQGADCSEIASKLLSAAAGKGKVIEVRPKQPGNLTLFENGAKEPGQFYHQVYTDGRYVYDPRLSSNPIPKGDWEQHIKGMNPEGVTISDKLKGL